MATDPYGAILATGVGQRLVRSLGLPNPERLRRYSPAGPLVPAPVLVGGLGDPSPLHEHVTSFLLREGAQLADPMDTDEVSGVVCDLTAAATVADLERLRAVLAPSLKRIGPSGRVVVLGRPVAGDTDAQTAAVRQALEGATRSVAKEMRHGGTANLVRVHDGVTHELDSPLRFLLSGRSAYVSGQVIDVDRSAAGGAADDTAPLAGLVAVVTGAARGIGAAIAQVLARDGADVVCVDIPASGEALATVANEIGGVALQVDVTAEHAGRRIAEQAHARYGRLDIVVHNAGITRDKLLANTDESRWAQVLDVNLDAVLRMNQVLLSDNGIGDNGRMVLVSSIAGIAGNRGQVNYGASKAGIVGLTRALGRDQSLVSRGVTVNAVAPGFIETEMTAKVPLATREVGRRLNSLQQGGLPVDVAETVAWFAQPGSGGVRGQVVRVCGQSLIGA